MPERAFGVSLDANTLTTASSSDKLRIRAWDAINRKELLHLDFEGVHFLFEFSPNGRICAIAIDGGKEEGKVVQLWNIQTGQVLQILKGHQGIVTNISFSVDGKTIATGSADKRVKLWDIQSGQELATLKGHTAAINLVKFSPDGKTLMSRDDNGVIKLWRAATDEEVARQQKDK